MSNAAPLAIWCISAATIAAILLRPGGIGEWVWAAGGAAIIVAAGLLPAPQAAHAAADGMDVYLFLAGMLTLAELARRHGVFEWLAGLVLRRDAGAPAHRALAWVYGSGVIVTALLSNDGTIVLLTPAAFAIARRARVAPLPLLYACAFVANAASFILPMSNPANLVVFRHLPALGPWFAAFGWPSLAAVLMTYAVLHLLTRGALCGRVANDTADPALSRTGKAALLTVSISAALVVLSAAFQGPVGLTACASAAASLAIVTIIDRSTPGAVLRHVAWSIIPLVAGLFVIVRALDSTGVLRYTRAFLRHTSALPPFQGNLLTGALVTAADNVLNNLPAGVIARYSLQNGAAPHIAHAVLVGIDLGPNLSVTGSLATLLWLITLRRENVEITAGHFLRTGALVTLPALVVALLLVH